MDRRDFLKFLGMASSATVLSSCGVEKGTEKLVSLTVPPKDPAYLPGEPVYKNSTCTECAMGCGITAKVVDFSPKKLEGNEEHPMNKGKLCLRGQSSLIRLYHPKRLRNPMRRKKGLSKLEEMSGETFEAISWEEAYQLIWQEVDKASAAGRKNVYLSGMTSGSLSELIDKFCNDTEVIRLAEYEVLAYTNLREAYRLLFDKAEIPYYNIEKSDLLLTIGADILETFLTPTNYEMQLQRAKENDKFSWLHFEPHASRTGFSADQRMTVKPGSEAYLLYYLLFATVKMKYGKNQLPEEIQQYLTQPNLSQLIDQTKAAEKTGLSAEKLTELLNRLKAAENPLIMAGGVSVTQKNGLETAMLAGLLQWIYSDQQVDFSKSQMFQNLGSLLDIRNLSRELLNKQIGVIFLSRSNPVATVPGTIKLKENLSAASFRVALTEFADSETARECDLLLPISTSFESWGDVNPRKGITGIVKPIVEPLYTTRSEGDILLNLSQRNAEKREQLTYKDWLHRRWSDQFGKFQLEHAVGTAFVEDDTYYVPLELNTGNLISFFSNMQMGEPSDKAVLYAVPSIRTYDGRSKVLQLTSEIPDPLTTISYGSWVSVSGKTSRNLKLTEEKLVHKERDEVQFESEGFSMSLPAFVQPGLPENVLTIHLDQIKPELLAVDERTGEYLSEIRNVSLVKTGRKKPLAIMAGEIEEGHRNIVTNKHEHKIPWLKGDETLYPKVKYPEYRWGMAIDLESCNGCSACVAACYIENNVPCVGEDEHLKGREMSWIRVQPYYEEAEDGNVSLNNLVMMCQQCGNAPCENVCPVYATYHNDEGINVMVYNRCIGTRYCHNNCPYKVRRFNWYDWTDNGYWQMPMQRMANPEVWIRPKGVMEKCNFCIQRIRKGKDHAKDKERSVRDGEIKPACAQTCPTDAITFGNLLDKNAEINKKLHSERSFRVLEMLGTNPAIHYLRKEETA